MPSAQPTVFVLFGATGDLAERMVLPAFYDSVARGLLPAFVEAGRQRPRRRRPRGLPRTTSTMCLTEFGPKPTEDRWTIRRTARSPAAGSRGQPGQPARRDRQAEATSAATSELIHYLAIPPSAFAPTTEA